jgi:hypothetical protein
LKKTEKTPFFPILPTNEEKQKNHNLVAYFEKSEKNIKILQVFSKFFKLFGSFFGILGGKCKKKKTCFFVFLLRLGVVFNLGHLVIF